MSITPNTKVVLNLAGFGTIAGVLFWIGATVTDAKWRMKSVEQEQAAIKAQVHQLPTKQDLIQVRLELQAAMADLRADTLKADRRRPRQ